MPRRTPTGSSLVPCVGGVKFAAKWSVTRLVRAGGFRVMHRHEDKHAQRLRGSAGGLIRSVCSTSMKPHMPLGVVGSRSANSAAKAARCLVVVQITSTPEW